MNFAKVLALAAMLSGCGIRHYVVEYVFDRRDVLPPLEGEKLSPSTLDLVAGVKTIAFVLPAPIAPSSSSQSPQATCLDLVVGAGRTGERIDLLASHCGTIMSELESAAQAAGFRVISWTSIKDPVMQYAKEHGVDMLVEINRFAFHDMAKDMYMQGKIKFYEEDEEMDWKWNELEVQDSKTVGQRCETLLHPQTASSEIAVVMDAKLVDARTGQLFWRQLYMEATQEDVVIKHHDFYRGNAKLDPEHVICHTVFSESRTDRWKRIHGKDELPTQAGTSYSLTPVTDIQHGDLARQMFRKSANGFMGIIVGVRNLYTSVSTKSRRPAKEVGAEVASLYKAGREDLQIGKAQHAEQRLKKAASLANGTRTPELSYAQMETCIKLAADMNTDNAQKTSKCQEAAQHYESYKNSKSISDTEKEILDKKLQACGKKYEKQSIDS